MGRQRQRPALLGRLSGHLCVWAGWSLVLLALFITTEVILRKLFSVSIQGADEIGGFVLATVSTIGFTYALYGRSHVRIDLLTGHLPVEVRAALNVIAYLVLSVFACVVLWRATSVLAFAIDKGSISPSPLGTPLKYPLAAWVASWGLFSTALVSETASAALSLFRGRYSVVAGRFGPPRAGGDLDRESQAAGAERETG